MHSCNQILLFKCGFCYSQWDSDEDLVGEKTLAEYLLNYSIVPLAY